MHHGAPPHPYADVKLRSTFDQSAKKLPERAALVLV